MRPCLLGLLSFRIATISMAHTAPRGAMRSIPQGMRTFFEKKLRSVGCSAVHADQLVNALVAATPADADCANSWVHRQFENALRAVEKEPKVASRLAVGEIDLLDAVALNEAHSEAALAMYNTINGHHRELRAIASASQRAEAEGRAAHIDASSREASGTDGEETDEETAAADEAWRLAKADDASLRAYAAAATRIGTRPWVQQGIEWMAAQATHFCHESGADGPSGEPMLYRLARKAAARLSQQTRGAPLQPAEEDTIRRALRRERLALHAPSAEPLAAVHAADTADGDAPLRSAWSRPVRLLDVGACGTLFDGFADIDDTAIDLCPQVRRPVGQLKSTQVTSLARWPHRARWPRLISPISPIARLTERRAGAGCAGRATVGHGVQGHYAMTVFVSVFICEGGHG